MAKICGFLILILLVWQQQNHLQKNIYTLLNLRPILRTTIEMERFANFTRQYLDVRLLEDANPQLPKPFDLWLDHSFKIRSGKRAGVDYFGTPYQAENPPEGYLIRSCGPSTVCGNSDDLIIKLYQQKADLLKINR
jgi:hypothetical protein